MAKSKKNASPRLASCNPASANRRAARLSVVILTSGILSLNSHAATLLSSVIPGVPQVAFTPSAGASAREGAVGVPQSAGGSAAVQPQSTHAEAPVQNQSGGHTTAHVPSGEGSHEGNTPSSPSVHNRAENHGGGHGAASHESSGPVVATPGAHGAQKTAAAVPAVDNKGGAPVEAMPTPVWTASIEEGWYNKYYFRGVNILKQISPSTQQNGIIDTKVNLQYSGIHDALSFNFGYVQALGRQMTDETAAENAPGKLKNGTPVSVRNERFRLTPNSRYEEYDFNLNYTHDLPYHFLGTIGYNRYNFSDGAFYTKDAKNPRNIDYADELELRLKFIGVPDLLRDLHLPDLPPGLSLVPSVSWDRDFDGFVGDFLQFRLDGGYDLILNKDRQTKVRFEPYVAASYDFKYNSNGSIKGASRADFPGDSWNDVEFGMRVPIPVTSFLTVALTGNYVHPFESGGYGQFRSNSGFWGGVTANVAWGGKFEHAEPVSPMGKDQKVISEAASAGDWEFSIGSGIRRFDYDFVSRTPKAADTFALNKPPFRISPIGLASPGNDVTYVNGAVLGSQTPPPPNIPLTSGGTFTHETAPVTTASPSQFRGSFATTTRQVAFLGYKTASQKQVRHDTSAGSGDTVASPEVKLDKQVWRSGDWSVRAGLLYSFSDSSSDSGLNLSRLDTLTLTTGRYIYNLDPINRNGTVILDASKFASDYQDQVSHTTFKKLRALSPVFEPSSTVNITNVATFTRTTMSINAHEIAVPISLRRDFGKLHVEASIAPTVTFVNGDLTSDVQRRDLPTASPAPKLASAPAAGAGVIFSTTSGLPPLPQGPFNPGTTLPTSGFTNPGGVNPSNPPPPSPHGATASPTSSGGKGGQNPPQPLLPGTSVGHRITDRSVTDVRFGVDGTVTLLYDLDDHGTWFADAWGTYHWADHASIGGNTADLKSFEAGVGLGVRF